MLIDKLRNPWGATEWKGKFSDGDAKSWTKRLRAKLEFVKADDGSFWMTFADFSRHFSGIHVCRVLDGATWASARALGAWKGPTAAGARDEFANPQFALIVAGQPVDLVVTLVQDDTRGHSGDAAEDRPIHLAIYAGDRRLSRGGGDDGGGGRRRGGGGGAPPRALNDTGSYKYGREVLLEPTLNPGSYVVIPSAYKKGSEASFTVRVFWRKDSDASVTLVPL